jgi:hypothetical protein
MEYDGVIDLLLVALWLLGCLLFAIFLIEFERTWWPTPSHPHTNWGLRGRTPSGLPAQFLALPRSFDEFPMPAELLNKVLPNSTDSLLRGKTIQASHWVCKEILLSRQF